MMLDVNDVIHILKEAGFQRPLNLPLWRRGDIFVQCVPDKVCATVLSSFELVYRASLPVDYAEFMGAIARVMLKWEK